MKSTTRSRLAKELYPVAAHLRQAGHDADATLVERAIEALEFNGESRRAAWAALGTATSGPTFSRQPPTFAATFRARQNNFC